MLYTIGYRKKSAEEFFEKLKDYNVKNIIDVRLKNTSHLAGFAKKEHLIYFLKEICNINYYHYEFLAPSNDILKDYKNNDIDWNEYEKRYNSLLKKRKVMKDLDVKFLENSCFLCAEKLAKKCHRRLAAEYINKNSNEIFEIKHL